MRPDHPETSGELREVKQQLEAKLGQTEKRAEQYRQRSAYWWLVMVTTAVLGPALAVAFSAYNTQQSERKFCALLDNSVVRAQQAVDAYDQAPPSTAAGRAQERRVRTSLADVQTLRRSLDCPPTKGIGS